MEEIQEKDLSGVYVGIITLVEKHYYQGIVSQEGKDDILIRAKVKRLNDKQKAILFAGMMCKIDMNDGKFYLKGKDKNWY